jgi:anaerobic selenocysteine-containing dehydrogenase
MLPEPGVENMEKWLNSRIKGYSHLSLDDLKDGPVLAPGLEHIAYGSHQFNTPSGRIELYSEEAERIWGVSPVPEFKQSGNGINENSYPLHFLTPNAAARIHSQFGNLDIIKTTVKEPSASISPADAKKRNIRNGNRIRIFNDQGEIISTAGISDRIPEGVIVLPNGIWLDEGGGGNFLVPGKFTDMGYGAAFHDTRVQVENSE